MSVNAARQIASMDPKHVLAALRQIILETRIITIHVIPSLNAPKNSMLYKHWRKLALAVAALFWWGCGDDTSSSDVKTACSFRGGGCPEYGVDAYFCENPEDYLSPDRDEKCTFSPRDPCTDYYECEDGASCYKDENETVMECFDAQGNSIAEDDVKATYYIKD